MTDDSRGVKTSRASYVSRRMTAFEQLKAEKKARRIPQLLVGLWGYGASLGFLVQSTLGASSWNVLAEGVAVQTDLSFGWATNVIAVAVLIFWVPLRELPGLGTVLNVFLVGVAADVTLFLVAPPNSFAQQLFYYVVGLALLTFCDAMYLGARFGSGPRDGLMTGAVRVTGRPVWLVRMVLEVVVVTVGWLLGGTVGLGTVVIALFMGPLVHQFLRLTTVPLRGDQHSDDGERLPEEVEVVLEEGLEDKAPREFQGLAYPPLPRWGWNRRS